MKTIKNTKLFNLLNEMGSADSRLENLTLTIFSQDSEFYLPEAPCIRVKRVGIYSDQVVFFDSQYEKNGIYRDNTFRIIPEEEK